MRAVTGLILLFFMLIVRPASAQTVQVPENCIDKVSPCLIHTQDTYFQFVHDGQLVKMLKDTIVKITFDDQKNNFEVLEGRISLNEQKKTLKSLHVNNKPVRTGQLQVYRQNGVLRILDLNDFVLSDYSVNPGLQEPKLLKADFINKNDFVMFTKFYFQNISQYKNFLSEKEKSWKSEFDRQNRSQTKVLLRTIASEREKARIEAHKNSAKYIREKKLRESFFYRTFER